MSTVNLSRRRFLRYSVIAGISVYLAPLHSKAFAALFENQLLTLPAWDPSTKHLRFRIDGKAKALGKKVFARDIRAADMPHWPATQSHAFILRATQADKRFDGLDLSLLEEGLQPDRLVTAKDLARDGLAFPPFYGDDMLLAQGKTPAYLGQAVAILIYHDFARYSVAKNRLKFQDQVIRYGEETGPLERDPWGTFRYLRVGGETSQDDDIFSSMKDLPIFPARLRNIYQYGLSAGKAGNSMNKGCITPSKLAKS